MLDRVSTTGRQIEVVCDNRNCSIRRAQGIDDGHQYRRRRAGGYRAAKAEERLNRLIGNTRILVIASHADMMLHRLCNKAALMEEGRLRMIGPVDEVLAAYNGAV